MLKFVQFTLFLFGFIALHTSTTHAQTRVFLDVPVLTYYNPNVEEFSDRMGLNLGIDLNVGSHNLVSRVGLGVNGTLAPSADDIGESVFTSLYGKGEIGAGLFRTNGKKCSIHNSNAYTALAIGGVRYNYLTKDFPLLPDEALAGYDGLDYYAGVELGYFFIRDVFKNYELFMRGDYSLKNKIISANVGFKLFLNLKARR